jgi:hypothetical protein
MVPQDCEEVKRRDGHAALISWIECHPRTGWYIAVLTTLNVVLNLLGLFH